MRIIEVVAKDHYEAGYRLGKQTAKLQRAFIRAFPFPRPMDELAERSLPFLQATKRIFPQYIEEIDGLAHGASVPFEIFWVLHCLDELEHKRFVEKCSSVFIKKENGHYMAGHNEDWNSWTKPYYFIQKRTVDRKTVLELGMCGAISGGTVSINSFGLIQAINTLHHTDFQVGVPRMIVARWLSSRKSITEIKTDFPQLHRAAGYGFNICDGRKLLAIESTAKRYSFFETEGNYAHTNHYIGRLKVNEEDNGNSAPSRERYKYISGKLPEIRSAADLRSLLMRRADDYSAVYRTTEVATVASLVFEPDKEKCAVTQENRGENTRWDSIPLKFLT